MTFLLKMKKETNEYFKELIQVHGTNFQTIPKKYTVKSHSINVLKHSSSSSLTRATLEILLVLPKLIHTVACATTAHLPQ